VVEGAVGRFDGVGGGGGGGVQFANQTLILLPRLKPRLTLPFPPLFTPLPILSNIHFLLFPIIDLFLTS